MSDAPPPRSTRGDGEWKPPAPPTLQRMRENLPPVGRATTGADKPTRVDPAPPPIPGRNASPLGMPLPPKNVPPTQNILSPKPSRPTAASGKS
ncbi:MAG: hypothetical protein HC924_18650, partial [Synechococcaceae cyanobacterium SM2_3_2]|nr:hypothetical protein [Synechococcaceae cyanobacterium SM2_3_2]